MKLMNMNPLLKSLTSFPRVEKSSDLCMFDAARQSENSALSSVLEKPIQD